MSAEKNDLFFKITLIGLDRTQTRFSESQETDTHWFATDGRGSFNFRNIFKFELPISRAALRIAASTEISSAPTMRSVRSPFRSRECVVSSCALLTTRRTVKWRTKL